MRMRFLRARQSIFFAAFSAIVTVSVFSYFFRHVELQDVREIIGGIDKNVLLMFVILSLSTSFFRMWRYLIALRASKQNVPPAILYLIVLVQNSFSDLLPARLGSAIYIYLVNSRLGINIPAATATFALVFLFDLLIIAPLVLVAAWLAQSETAVSAGSLLFGGTVIAVITGSMICLLPRLCRIAQRLAMALPSRLTSLQTKIVRFLEATETELHNAKEAGIYGKIAVLSLLVRLGKYGSLYLLLCGLLFPLGFSFEKVQPGSTFLGIFAAELAASLPISGLAGFGAYEGAWALTFKLLGFPADIARLTAVSHHLFTQIYGYALGLSALGALLILPCFASFTAASQRNCGKTRAFYPRLVMFLLLLSLAVSAAYSIPLQKKQHYAKNVAGPNESEREAMRSLAEELAGHSIVFDSNRSGTFGIYVLDLGTMQTKMLADTEWQEEFPDVAPDGKRIVYARSRATLRIAPSSVWIMERDGTNPRLLARNGTFPTFSSDGKTVYFERNRKKVMALNLESGSMSTLFPKKGTEFQDFAVVKPRIAPSGLRVAFTSDRPGRWNAWFADVATSAGHPINAGCEPAWINDQELVWIKKSGVPGGSGIYRMQTSSGEKTVLEDAGAKFGHEYFPTLALQAKYLLYGACPANQHSHLDSNYQIFVRPLQGQRVRLTFDGYTNRWPKLLAPAG